ncbi:unnamed protein product [Lactuca saligna]|uniref:Uncharacterized protein n=1 Tax=Lactuca saligna TaxID=75948 RepID=A0AA36A1L6_LACSI|nr:unnamed protein product [Lactuca saligna]
MATCKVRTSSFSKNFSAAPTSSVPGLKRICGLLGNIRSTLGKISNITRSEMGNRVECFSLLDCLNLVGFRDSCSKFISQFPKYDGNITSAGRIAIQSF